MQFINKNNHTFYRHQKNIECLVQNFKYSILKDKFLFGINEEHFVNFHQDFLRGLFGGKCQHFIKEKLNKKCFILLSHIVMHLTETIFI